VTNAYQPTSEQVRRQVALYEATDGREGGTLDGRPVVILTTIGAKTGGIRKNPIMRIEEGGCYVAVASNAGGARNPSWYHNLIAHPDVSLQDGAIVYRLRAREVSGDEKARWWLAAEREWPHYAEFHVGYGGRDIPVLVLEPAGR
jgi:deazaflavin-dependent oxidoreductase (nitroreductase family)